MRRGRRGARLPRWMADDDVRKAIEVLERLGGNLRSLAELDEDTRIRLVIAAGPAVAAGPLRRRRSARCSFASTSREAARRTATKLDATGIRALRRSRCSARRCRSRSQALDAPVRDDDGEPDPWAQAEAMHVPRVQTRAPLLRVQGRLPRAAPLLRSDVPAVRRAQLARSATRPPICAAASRSSPVRASRSATRPRSCCCGPAPRSIVVTRFPRDAARRFAREPDAAEWTRDCTSTASTCGTRRASSGCARTSSRRCRGSTR